MGFILMVFLVLHNFLFYSYLSLFSHSSGLKEVW